MLIPMQPWGEAAGSYLPSIHAMLAVHLDWYMLAFMEFACATLFIFFPAISSNSISIALMFGGWINPIAYLLRDIGIDAFVIAGDPPQLFAACICGISAGAILISWTIIVYRLHKLLRLSKEGKMK